MANGYNAYQWNNNLGGSTEEKYLRNSYNNMGRFTNQLSNFSSPFYQQYASYINKATPGVGTNAFLSPLMAGGGNYAGGMSQALALKENAMRKRQDMMNTGLQGFASGNLGMIGSLLQGQGQVASSAYSTKTQKEIAEQQGSPWQMFGGLAGGIGGAFTAQGLAGLGPLAFLASDIRFKENILYTGEQTKDGISIVEFNYINDKQRYKGVIAQDVEKIRPDAVREYQGYKYVNYGAL